MEKDQDITKALINSLQPDDKTLNRLEKSFKNARIWKKVRVKKYSAKKKKTVYYWKWRKRRIVFKEGIYILKLNKKLQIVKSRRTSQVLLDPKKYQNHQYLKNSYFAKTTKHKTL